MATTRPSSEKKTIFIVDDSALNREMLSDILGDAYDYLYAQDGEEALKLLSVGTPVDILLLDMNMPKMGGMDVLKAMHERRWTDEIPVVIISADSDMGFMRNAYRLGAIDYIVRPFDAFLVQHRVENTLMLYSQKNRLVKLVEQQVLQREKTNNMLINIFSHVVEIRNFESGSHTLRVQHFTNLLLNHLVKITDRYALSEADIALISSVSALHDIGKVIIPAAILNKPGKLTPVEWEVMQSHTTEGDRFLSEIPIDQTEPLMIAAHEIVRHHHERYDGSGYPDGLKGDDIPISAQIVSIADVYDALTSDRCYKKAFSHDTAIQMMLNGECGAFNPLLLRCLEEISDKLLFCAESNEHGYVNDVHTLTNEAMAREEVYTNDRLSYLVDCEREKKEFFSNLCGGIQFEYDALMGKILSIDYHDHTGRKIALPPNTTYLLQEEDWARLRERVRNTSPEHPTVTMNVLVPINQNLRWYRLTVRTLWRETSHTYVGVIGQFTDIHDSVIAREKYLRVNDQIITGDNLVAMRHIFDIVRLVNPENCEVLKIMEDGSTKACGIRCFELWGRKGRCANCMCGKAQKATNWMSRLESKGNRIYSVLSHCAQYQDKDCVLVLGLAMEEPPEQTREDIGFIPDNLTLQLYYRDTLTRAFSRAYLENFNANLEGAQGVAMIDVDHFKQINDTFGHLVGDAALRHIAMTIRTYIRESDVLVRYGGDEFLLIIRDIDADDFFKMLERIRQGISQSVMIEYPSLHLDISIGGVHGNLPLMQAVEAADKAMYRDKFRKKE